jgi:V/A-type H+-transporting ATPase subunit E
VTHEPKETLISHDRVLQMQAEQVIEKILSDARAEAARINKEAEEREAGERARPDEEISRFDEQTQAMAAKAATEERSQRLAVARMEASKEYLAAKGEIMDEVFAKAHEQFLKLPDAEYRDLMARLMVAAAESGDEQVVVGRKDSRIDQALIDAVNGKLKDRSKGALKLSDEKQDLAGGFILRRGRIRTNVSVDVLVGQAREALEIELAKDLFSKDTDVSKAR